MLVDDYVIPVRKQRKEEEQGRPRYTTEQILSESRLRLQGEEDESSEGSCEADFGTQHPDEHFSTLSAYKAQSRNRSKDLERPKTPVANSSLTISDELRRMEKNIARTNYMSMYRSSIGADDIRKSHFPEAGLALEIRTKHTANVQAE